MTLQKYWTRQEVIKISNLTRGQFQVFEKLDIVRPLKFPSGRNGLVLYTWDNLLVIKAYSKLREQASLQSIKEALNFFAYKWDFTEAMLNKKLVVFKNQVYWIDGNEESTEFIQVSGTRQLIMSFNIQDLVNEMLIKGKECKITDFEERFKQAMEEIKAA